jgi:hypothetical protein
MPGRQRLGAEDKLCGDNVTRPDLYTHRNDGSRLRNADTDRNGDKYANCDRYGYTDRFAELHTGDIMADGSSDAGT